MRRALVLGSGSDLSTDSSAGLVVGGLIALTAIGIFFATLNQKGSPR